VTAPAKNKIQTRHLAMSALLVVIGVLFIVTLKVALTQNPKAIPSALMDKPALPFNAQWLQGKEHLSNPEGENFTLDSFKGRPVVLNFWASWCVSCREEARDLETFWQTQRGNTDTLIVGIAIQDTPEAAKEFAAAFGKTYILGIDVDGKASIDYGVTGVPETFFIDRTGVVRHKEAGPVTVAMMKNLLPKIQQ
jgi:cytochrome c biogenesis protein CcmG, thiol:disulfide interchange protein DsbE